MPGSPAHLFSRFFDVLTSRPLTIADRERVESWLPSELATVFLSQSSADQRHGFHSASMVVSFEKTRPDVIVAALMHDVGKRHSRLGLMGRSLTSLFILLRLPLTVRMRLYRDHGIVAARELGRLGAPSLAIDFALHHHGARPATIEPSIWDSLLAADQPPKASAMLGRRITSADT